MKHRMIHNMLKKSNGNNSLYKTKWGNARMVEKIEEGQKRKAGRNEPCPCGSGKKYKKCCLK